MKKSPIFSVASTSQEGQEEEPCLSHDGRLRVTLLSSEWKSSKGGLSTINRELAIQLAKHPNVEVSVYLPQCSEEDRKIASSNSVQLIEAEKLPGLEPIYWLSSLPKGHFPHCVIGHGVPLGRQIPLIKRHHDCQWIQVVHTAPEELGMFKSYEEAISKGEQKHQAEVKLCELADQVVAVGPKLKDAYSRYLRYSGKDQDVLNLTPGIFSEFYGIKQATEERSTFSVLVFGRGDNEDFELKGYDIAAQAIAKLKDSSYQLVFVGAPAESEDAVAERLLQHGIPASQLTVRRFKESREELAHLFCEVDLAIMPSRTEGFGLAALEALSAGLPVLVSGNSGLGDALKKVPSGRSHVVDSEEPLEWGKAIRIVRQKGREVRLEDSKILREKYAVKYNWQKQCDCLVEKMLNLTFGSLGTGHPSTALSYVPSGSFEEPKDLRVCQKGSFGTGNHSSVECINPLPFHEPYPGLKELTNLGLLQEDSSGTWQPLLVKSNLQLPSHSACSRPGVPSVVTVHQEGSLERREGSTGKGKRWLSAGAKSRRPLKGSGHRIFRELLKDEYIRRSNLKPLLWDSTIHLPLEEVYTRLEVKWRKNIDFQLTDREVHMYEIFNRGERVGNTGWSQKLRYTFKKAGNQEQARMVLVEGSPGIGKTTFCLKIANDWARKAIPKKHGFPVFKLMLLLKCRDIDGDVMQAIEDQLLPEDIAEKKKNVLLDFVMDEKNKDKILLILDGLDELPQVAEQFVDKLLKRKVLSHCSVLATSRQEKGIELRQSYDFDSLLQINGFTIGDASEYIRRHFRTVDSKDLLKGERLIHEIVENSFLHALRNNPLNLLLLCVVFEDFEGDLPSNRSELYQIICRCLLRRFCSKNNLEINRDDRALENQFEASILVLGELAWGCLLEDRPCFLEEELEKLEKSITSGKGVSVVKLGFVFMEASFKKLNPRHEYHFVHRTFQEYLAAAYLALKMMKDEINLFDYFQLGKRDITRKNRQVFLFVAGILGKDGTVFFKQVGELFNRNWNWKSPDKEDCEFLTELLNESGASVELAKVVWPCIPLPQSLELSLRDGHTLRFLRYAHEASSHERDLQPVHLTKLTLTEAHYLKGDIAGDVQCILNNKALKNLFISTDRMTDALKHTLLKELSSSNLSLSSVTLNTSDIAVTFERSLLSCNSLTTVTFRLIEESNNGAESNERKVTLKPKEEIDIFHYLQLDKRDITRKYRRVFMFVASVLGKDGSVFFKQVGELFNRNWNWQSPDKEDCEFLTELLNVSGAADKLAMVVWRFIPLPQSLELSLRDGQTFHRFVRYAHEASLCERDSQPVHLSKLTLTEGHYLTEYSASDVQRILNTKALKDLIISTYKMTTLLTSTLLKVLSASNLSLSSITLNTSDIAVTFERNPSSCNSLTTATLRLIEKRKDAYERNGREVMLNPKEEIDTFYNLIDKRDITRKYRRVFMFVASVLGKDGSVFFKQVGELFNRNWNWQSPDKEDCEFLTELLNVSGAADKLAKVVWRCIPLPQSLELSLRDGQTFHRFVRYAHEVSLCERDSQPVHLSKLTLTEGHYLTEDSASDVLHILNNNALKDLFIFTNEMTSSLKNTLSRLLSASNSSFSTLSLKGRNFFVRFERRLPSCNSLTTVTLTLVENSNNGWSRAVNTGLSASTQLKSVVLQFHSPMSSTVVETLGLLLSNASLISFTLIVFGNMEDCLASALSQGLSGETALESLTVIAHGSLSNLGADLLVKSVQENRTLHSLTFKVFGDVPENWVAVVDKVHLLAEKKVLKSLMIHPNAQGKLANASISLLNPISRDNPLDKTLTLNIWGELSIFNVESLGDYLLKFSPSPSSFTLNVHGKVSNGVADCLVNIFSTDNVLPSLTINLWGEITSYGRTALHRLRSEGQKQSFILNVHGLVTEHLGCSSARNICSTSSSLLAETSNTSPRKLSEILLESNSLTELDVEVFDDAGANATLRHAPTNGLVQSTVCVETGENWGYSLGSGLAKNKSLTSLRITVYNYPDTRRDWGHDLGNGLAENKSLTTFSLTVYNHADSGGHWGHGLGNGLAKNKSLTAFSLTVYHYTDTRGDWGYGFGNGLAKNKSLTTFSLKVFNQTGTRGDWGHDLGNGLAENKSLTKFSLTVYNHADTGGDWGHGLGNALAKNKSLTAFSLTVYNYTGTRGDWGPGLGNGLAKNESLTTFSLTFYNYTGTRGDWAHGLGSGLAKNKSLTTFSLTVYNYADTRGDWEHGLGNGLAKNKSLKALSLSFHNYTDTTEEWGHGLAEGLAENVSLKRLRLSFDDHSSLKRSRRYSVLQRLEEIKSLTSLSLSVTLYGEDNNLLAKKQT